MLNTMDIKTATLNGVATIEIARSHKKNALTAEMYSAMAAAVRAADADTTVRALQITGQPGIFTSGNDIDDFMTRPPSTPDAPVFDFMRALVACRKPVVAAVTGAAIGIGTTMLLPAIWSTCRTRRAWRCPLRASGWCLSSPPA